MSEEKKVLSPAKRKALVDLYEDFLRVGRVTVAEWFNLDDEERACMLVAQRRIDLERAICSATAIDGPEAVAALMSSIDGGDMLVRLAIETAMARYVQKAGAA